MEDVRARLAGQSKDALVELLSAPRAGSRAYATGHRLEERVSRQHLLQTVGARRLTASRRGMAHSLPQQ
jgi:hypothetical protein